MAPWMVVGSRILTLSLFGQQEDETHHHGVGERAHVRDGNRNDGLEMS